MLSAGRSRACRCSLAASCHGTKCPTATSPGTVPPACQSMAGHAGLAGAAGRGGGWPVPHPRTSGCPTRAPPRPALRLMRFEYEVLIFVLLLVVSVRSGRRAGGGVRLSSTGRDPHSCGTRAILTGTLSINIYYTFFRKIFSQKTKVEGNITSVL